MTICQNRSVEVGLEFVTPEIPEELRVLPMKIVLLEITALHLASMFQRVHPLLSSLPRPKTAT